MDLNNFFQSKTFIKIIFAILGIIILLFVFKAGMMVGFLKANFSCRWGENYYKNFVGQRNGTRNFFDKNFIGPHGVSGSIMDINLPVLTIKGFDNIEKMVLLNEETLIRRFEETLKPEELKINDVVTIIGAPNNEGQIEAKFIRVLPEPPPKSFSSKGFPFSDNH